MDRTAAPLLPARPCVLCDGEEVIVRELPLPQGGFYRKSEPCSACNPHARPASFDSAETFALPERPLFSFYAATHGELRDEIRELREQLACAQAAADEWRTLAKGKDMLREAARERADAVRALAQEALEMAAQTVLRVCGPSREAQTAAAQLRGLLR